VTHALRLNRAVRDPIPYYMLMLDKVRRSASKFDILHFHIEQFHFPIFHDQATRTVTTLHGRQDLPDLEFLYSGFCDMPLVRVSTAQRQHTASANVIATVPHGIPRDLHTLTSVAGLDSYLAFLGRISPEKRVDRAIAIARAAGLPLKIAAKVDRVDEEYFKTEIAPLLSQPGVEFIGEIDERHKTRFLGDACALLFPIDWPEPFGLVMIEAMACGTPVLAFRRGSVPEVVEDGVTGYVVDNLEEAIAKVDSILSLDRTQVRRRFEQRFTAERMAQDYLKLYAKLIGNVRAGNRAHPVVRPSHSLDNLSPNGVFPERSGIDSVSDFCTATSAASLSPSPVEPDPDA
jgi:glycosyltransferase involved in cell wall biosynthesis